MGYAPELDHYITALPASPFVNVEEIVDDRRFVLNENQFFDAIKAPSDRWPMLDWPVWATWTPDDPPPLFLSDPSPDFLDALYRELAPFIEQRARAA